MKLQNQEKRTRRIFFARTVIPLSLARLQIRVDLLDSCGFAFPLRTCLRRDLNPCALPLLILRASFPYLGHAPVADARLVAQCAEKPCLFRRLPGARHKDIRNGQALGQRVELAELPLEQRLQLPFILMQRARVLGVHLLVSFGGRTKLLGVFKKEAELGIKLGSAFLRQDVVGDFRLGISGHRAPGART